MFGQLVRLTIDSEVQAYNQRLSSRPNLNRPGPTHERLVVELKAPASDEAHERLAEVLAGFPIRPDRHSKYVQGVLAGPDFDGVDLL